ncbi:hypothetical protein [Pseudomonas aeruginosa]|uniref:hypothetical protein n=1 Tax=Pseudomonas aeruginosa TaxID=287 RepID=UPI000F524F9C|nr:hypothetical protein [Pseudomonas aeruginosa]
MRTADPQNIKADFLKGLRDVEDVLNGVSGTNLGVASKNLVVEYAFLGASILLEGFISDLFVAYINKKNEKFVGYLTSRMNISSDDSYARQAINNNHASVDIGSHLTVEAIRNILDPKSYNITFPTAGEMKASANKWLSAPYDGQIAGISARHSSMLDAIKSIRNYLAHRSSYSSVTMQASLIGKNLPAQFKRNKKKVEKVGYFLESMGVGYKVRRVDFFISELRDIANQLCP